MTTVETVGWDNTLGLAETWIGKWFIWATSWTKESVPEHIQHVGIKVYGYLYEYGDFGILKTKIPNDGIPISKYPSCSLQAIVNVGETERTREEFEAWIQELNKEVFQGCRYDIVGHNCIMWAIQATEFLGVTYPPNWDKINIYAHTHKYVARAVGGFVLSSRQRLVNFEPLGTYE